GEIVKRHAPGEREALPLIAGLTREEVEDDDGRARAGLRSAIAFLGELRAVLGKDAPEVEELHVDRVMGLSVVCVGDDARIQFGPPPWKDRLKKLAEVRSALRERGLKASEIALGGQRRPERIVARL